MTPNPMTDFLALAATMATPDAATRERLVATFYGMLNTSGRVMLGVKRDDSGGPTHIGVEHGGKDKRRTNDIAMDSVTDAMSLCARLSLYPSPSASPMTPPQFRGEAMEIGPNHRGWARMLAREGIRIKPIVVHRDDKVELIDDCVRLNRNPGVRVDNQNDLLGVALYADKDGQRILEHWVPAATIRKRAGKSKGFAHREWFAEFAAAASIRDAIARGGLACESDAVDAAMTFSGSDDDEPESNRRTKSAVNPASIPDSEVELPPALRDEPEEAAPLSLDDLLSGNGLTRDDVDAWLVAHGKSKLADASAESVATLTGWLAADNKRIRAIAAHTTPPKGEE